MRDSLTDLLLRSSITVRAIRIFRPTGVEARVNARVPLALADQEYVLIPKSQFDKLLQEVRDLEKQ